MDMYHHLIMSSLTPSMIHLTLYNYHDNGNVVTDHQLWLPLCLLLWLVMILLIPLIW